MTNYLLKYEAKKLLSAIRTLSGHRMAHYDYLGCQISSKKVSDGNFKITYLFSWQIMPNDLDFKFKFEVETTNEILHRATNYVYDDDTARDCRSLYVLLRRQIPLELIYAHHEDNLLIDALTSASIRIKDYYKYGIMVD